MRQLGADGAVDVAHIVGQLHLFAFLKQRPGVGDHLRVQGLGDFVAAFHHVARRQPTRIRLHQQRIQVEIVEVRPATLGFLKRKLLPWRKVLAEATTEEQQIDAVVEFLKLIPVPPPEQTRAAPAPAPRNPASQPTQQQR
mgnify:CR=1 FL=1